MPNPLLSICIPTYNRPELLKRTLESVVTASDRLEILVTDNSTDDRVEGVTREFMSSAPCDWEYHRNDFPRDKSNLELMVLNLNRGVSLAKGRYIYIIHDDDFMADGAIDMLLRDLEGRASNSAVIKYGVHLVNIDGHVTKTRNCREQRYLTPREALLAVLSNSSFARAPSIVFRRDVYEEVGDWSLEAEGMDTEIFVRAFRKFGVLELPEVLSCYTIHAQAQTMGLFNEHTIGLLVDLFDQADPEGLLTAAEMCKAKALFFHQFILGGTYRLLRGLRLSDAKRVMSLFSSEAVRDLPTPAKWRPVRMAFGSILAAVP